jgi:hypothetical protein
MTTTPDAAKARPDVRRQLQTGSTHRMYSYNVIQRIIDARQGRRTARTTACADINDTPLLQRLCWTYAESAHHVFTRGQAANHEAIALLQHDADRLADVLEEVARLEAELAAVAEPDLSVRRGGEEHLEADAVRTRRQREAQAERALPARRLADARERAQVLRERCRTWEADLLEQYDLVLAAEHRLRAYTLRRAANYGRAWDSLRSEAVVGIELPVPHWATRADCPWLPAGFEALMAPATTKGDER